MTKPTSEWSTPNLGWAPLACRDAEIEGAKMPHRSKLRTEQHMIDADGQRLLKEKMPKAWVLREYRPDYGLDYAVEAFCESGVDQLGKARYETLGEHFFIQLKSCRATKRGSLEIFGRDNVEKTPEKLNFDDRVGNLETIRLSIETPELVTVQRMGAAVPVLLVVADLGAASCYFLCLNDYIDKVLVPRHGNYTDAGTRTVHIPTRNELDGTESACKALRWYSKRPKLYAAFMKFFYQERELQYARNGPDFDETAKYFAQLICAYDFWDDVEMCTAIGRYGTALRLFLETGSPGLMTTRSEVLDRIAGGSVEQREFLQEQFRRDEVAELWRLLSTLPRIYEDVWREWLLPTALGYATSF